MRAAGLVAAAGIIIAATKLLICLRALLRCRVLFTGFDGYEQESQRYPFVRGGGAYGLKRTAFADAILWRGGRGADFQIPGFGNHRHGDLPRRKADRVI